MYTNGRKTSQLLFRNVFQPDLKFVFERKKNHHPKRCKGLLRVNGCSLLLLLGKEKLVGVDILIRVYGGGHVTQVYAIRQFIPKELFSFYQKYVDEASCKELKDILIQFGRTLLVADPRLCNPKKFGSPGAHTRYEESFS
ncbi:hypothetical protein RP20_CCG020780 [Aedes albopictus]|nr:hypothetical protein RP20_CCG020780 [Aedes albopictus]